MAIVRNISISMIMSHPQSPTPRLHRSNLPVIKIVAIRELSCRWSRAYPSQMASYATYIQPPMPPTILSQAHSLIVTSLNIWETAFCLM